MSHNSANLTPYCSNLFDLNNGYAVDKWGVIYGRNETNIHAEMFFGDNGQTNYNVLPAVSDARVYHSPYAVFTTVLTSCGNEDSGSSSNAWGDRVLPVRKLNTSKQMQNTYEVLKEGQCFAWIRFDTSFSGHGSNDEDTCCCEHSSDGINWWPNIFSLIDVIDLIGYAKPLHFNTLTLSWFIHTTAESTFMQPDLIAKFTRMDCILKEIKYMRLRREWNGGVEKVEVCGEEFPNKIQFRINWYNDDAQQEREEEKNKGQQHTNNIAAVLSPHISGLAAMFVDKRHSARAKHIPVRKPVTVWLFPSLYISIRGVKNCKDAQTILHFITQRIEEIKDVPHNMQLAYHRDSHLWADEFGFLYARFHNVGDRVCKDWVTQSHIRDNSENEHFTHICVGRTTNVNSTSAQIKLHIPNHHLPGCDTKGMCHQNSTMDCCRRQYRQEHYSISSVTVVPVPKRYLFGEHVNSLECFFTDVRTHRILYDLLGHVCGRARKVFDADKYARHKNAERYFQLHGFNIYMRKEIVGHYEYVRNHESDNTVSNLLSLSHSKTLVQHAKEDCVDEDEEEHVDAEHGDTVLAVQKMNPFLIPGTAITGYAPSITAPFVDLINAHFEIPFQMDRYHLTEVFAQAGLHINMLTNKNKGVLLYYFLTGPRESQIDFSTHGVLDRSKNSREQKWRYVTVSIHLQGSCIIAGAYGSEQLYQDIFNTITQLILKHIDDVVCKSNCLIRLLN